MDVEVEGADRLASTLAKAARDLDAQADDAAGEVADLVARDARGRTPRRTGALASTVSAHGPVVQAGSTLVDYAPYVHFGVRSRNIPARPFLTDAVTATQPRWADLVMARLSRILSRIRGA